MSLELSEAREIFAANLKAVMAERDWTVGDVSVLIDLGAGTVLAWVNGEEFPCPRHFARVAMISGRSREELLCQS